MLFVIFDVETIFIYSWAVAFRELGWYGYLGVLIFVILLFVVLIYEWKNGALDFGPDGNKILKAYKKKIALRSLKASSKTDDSKRTSPPSGKEAREKESSVAL
jgi:hypothetical protein